MYLLTGNPKQINVKCLVSCKLTAIPNTKPYRCNWTAESIYSITSVFYFRHRLNLWATDAFCFIFRLTYVATFIDLVHVRINNNISLSLAENYQCMINHTRERSKTVSVRLIFSEFTNWTSCQLFCAGTSCTGNFFWVTVCVLEVDFLTPGEIMQKLSMNVNRIKLSTCVPYLLYRLPYLDFCQVSSNAIQYFLLPANRSSINQKTKMRVKLFALCGILATRGRSVKSNS